MEKWPSGLHARTIPHREWTTALLAAGLCGILVAHPVVRADQNTGAIPVSATVENECRVGAARLDFGTYNPIGLNATQSLDSEAVVEVSCTPGTRAVVGLGTGLHPSSGQRRMSSAGGQDWLTYELYQDSSRTRVWTNVETVTIPTFGPGPERLRVHGRVPFGQDAAAGSYSDSVIIVIVF